MKEQMTRAEEIGALIKRILLLAPGSGLHIGITVKAAPKKETEHEAR